MHGEIGVRSTPGAGSTFWFTVLAGDASKPEQIDPSVASLRGKRALVVDDNAATSRVLACLLEGWGMTTAQVTGGRGALDLLVQKQQSAEPFDFVLADMRMPEMDGLELASRIKADSRLALTKAVILSSISQSGIRQRAVEVGAEGYLSKPIRQTHLLRLLSRLAAPGSDGGPELIPVSLVRLDEAARSAGTLGHILVVEDNMVNQQVVSRMLEKLGYRVDAVGNGLEALDALGKIPYSMVFMDCQMPEMDGFCATREIRRNEGVEQQVTNVAITASARNGDREKCLKAGMDDYISKPVRMEDIWSVVEKWSGPVREPALRDGVTGA